MPKQVYQNMVCFSVFFCMKDSVQWLKNKRDYTIVRLESLGGSDWEPPILEKAEHSYIGLAGGNESVNSFKTKHDIKYHFV